MKLARGSKLMNHENLYLDMVFREWNKYFQDKEPSLEETKNWYNYIFVPSLISK